MPVRELLEEYPLYRKYSACPWAYLHLVDKPTIHMDCPVCQAGQTYAMENEYYEGYPYSNFPVAGQTVRVVYQCLGCHKFKRSFLVYFDEKRQFVVKVGQQPAWSIEVDRQLTKMLGERVSAYRKGLVCESQGYGIGAFSYYRRIVEEVIDELLDEIATLIPYPEQAVYAKALAAAKATRVAQDKIALVKDLLPHSLRPDGLNPLAVLHDVLSEGLHVESDERCLALAASAREVLVFMVDQVLAHKSAAKSFGENIRKLLDRKKP